MDEFVSNTVPEKKRKKKKKKRSKVPMYVMSAAAILAAVSMASMIYTGTRGSREPVAQEPVTEGIDYSSYVKGSNSLSYPILPTDIDNLYVEMFPNGKFKFYLADTATSSLVPYTDVKTAEVTADCSSEDIPATVYYVEKDNKITGFGLFTTSISQADVRLYSYAFFRLTSTPNGYGSSDALLLVDFDSNDFTSPDKTYSEVFGYDITKNEATRLTSNNGRTVDENGRLRTDWTILTENFLKSCGGNRYYLSGRNYNLNMSDEICDVIINKDSSKTKPTLVVSGITGSFLSQKNGVLVYLKKTDTGFNSTALYGGKESVIASFTGSLEDDYILSGSYLLNKTTLALTDIMTGKSRTLKSTVTPTAFGVSPDGTKAVILSDEVTQTAVLWNFSSGAETVCTGENIFAAEYPVVMWNTDGSFVVVNSVADSLSYSVMSF